MNGKDVRIIIAENIKSFRETRKMSQADLAFEAGISIPFLSDIERGNKWPSPDTFAKIATALEINIYELFVPITLKIKQNPVVATMFNELLISQKIAAEDVYKKYLH